MSFPLFGALEHHSKFILEWLCDNGSICLRKIIANFEGPAGIEIHSLHDKDAAYRILLEKSPIVCRELRFIIAKYEAYLNPQPQINILHRFVIADPLDFWSAICNKEVEQWKICTVNMNIRILLEIEKERIANSINKIKPATSKVIVWDQNDFSEIEDAHRNFETYLKEGYRAYYRKHKSWIRILSFDPHLEEIIMRIPQKAGWNIPVANDIPSFKLNDLFAEAKRLFKAAQLTEKDISTSTESIYAKIDG